MVYWGCGRLRMTLHFQQMTMIKGVVCCKGFGCGLSAWSRRTGFVVYYNWGIVTI